MTGGVGRVNELAPKVPRRSVALLQDERRHRVTVLSRVIETPVLLRPASRSVPPVYALHRTVRVHVDGEEEPRRIEYTRLTEFAGVELATEIQA